MSSQFAGINDYLRKRAEAYARRHAIAGVGDIVETTWGGWKKPRKVRIVKIGVRLYAEHSQRLGWHVRFDMTFVAHRIRKDGSSSEYNPDPGSGIYLTNLRAPRGSWKARPHSFNHIALTWDCTPPPPSAEPRPVNPLRIQRQRAKGWRAPAEAVYVGRPTCWGNPYERDDMGSSDLLVAMYRDWIKGDSRSAEIARRRLPELRGKVLMCWCPADQPCHADVLLDLANAPTCEAVAA